jgi:CBS domain-containing protein
MALDELSPFALHWSVAAAHDEEQLVKITAQLPAVFLGLMDARLDAASVMRVLTLHSDAVTRRLLELSFARHGQPPVDYSWFALGSGARNEMALSSDQDHALAYADTDDPSVDDFFGRVAADVHGGLLRCGYEADPSGVTAADYHWRMSESQWVDIFTRCLKTWDWRYLMRASLAFDFRCVAGGLLVEPRLREIVRRAAGHSGFLRRMARMAGEIRSPLGFRQRLPGRIDLKDSGLRPISNLARYYAFADGIGVSNTLERLAAARALGSRFADTAQSLSEAFVCISTLRLEHHATAVRAGTDLDDVVDADELRPLSAAELQEALRLVAAAQRRAIS